MAATPTSAKRFVITAMTLIVGTTTVRIVTSHNGKGGDIYRVAAGGLFSAALLLALAEPAPQAVTYFTATALIASLLAGPGLGDLALHLTSVPTVANQQGHAPQTPSGPITGPTRKDPTPGHVDPGNPPLSA